MDDKYQLMNIQSDKVIKKIVKEGEMQILKFRSFSSREREGFILFKKGPLPQLIIQDILFQLFEPLFPEIYCPEVYFFSSTDQILKIQQLSKVKDYIYIHFLERIDKYVRNQTIRTKLKICSIDKMSTGISFQGTNLYIFSEKQFLMYGKEVFRNSLHKKISGLSLKQEHKNIKYNQYLKELQEVKDNFQMIKLKDQIKNKVDKFNQQTQHLEIIYSRYLKIKGTLGSILKNSGINIQTIADLK